MSRTSFMILKQLTKSSDTTDYLVSDNMGNLYLIETEYIDIQAYGWIYDITVYDMKNMCSRKYTRVYWPAMNGNLLKYGQELISSMENGILHLEEYRRGKCIITHITENQRITLLKETEEKKHAFS